MKYASSAYNTPCPHPNGKTLVGYVREPHLLLLFIHHDTFPVHQYHLPDVWVRSSRWCCTWAYRRVSWDARCSLYTHSHKANLRCFSAGNVENVYSDIGILLYPFSSPGVNPPSGTLVHAGIHDAYNSIAPQVISLVRSQITAHPTYTVFTAGHRSVLLSRITHQV